MGLLDDAIRQHLELKRQHGADPGDVAKKAQEAFGPIKRGDLEVDVAAEDDELLDEDEEAAGPGDSRAEEPAREPVAAPLPPLEPAPDPVVEPSLGTEESAPASGSVALPEEPAFAEPEPSEAPAEEAFAPTAEPDAYAPAASEPAPPVPPVEEPGGGFEDIGEPTQEYSVLDDAPDPQPDAAASELDELEETPDFLEETPEHDRLWFEQKPPRDFDF